MSPFVSFIFLAKFTLVALAITCMRISFSGSKFELYQFIEKDNQNERYTLWVQID